MNRPNALSLDFSDIGLTYQTTISIILFLAIARILGLRISAKPWFVKIDMPIFFFIFSGLWCQAKGLKIEPNNYHLRVQEFLSGDNQTTRTGQLLMIVSSLVIFLAPVLEKMFNSLD